MKKLVLVFGLLFALSTAFPNAKVALPKWPVGPTPVVTPDVVVVPADATVAKILASASAADRARVNSVYGGLATVLKRDGGKRVATTEQFAELQARTLTMAIETPGKYPGLDVAIEDCFKRAVGTTDVVSVTPELSAKLVDAAQSIANAAK